jgi:hypothetical protein
MRFKGRNDHNDKDPSINTLIISSYYIKISTPALVDSPVVLYKSLLFRNYNYKYQVDTNPQCSSLTFTKQGFL